MSTPNQTLTGVRVVSLAINLPGPLAAQVQKEMERRPKAAQEAAQAADNDTKE